MTFSTFLWYNISESEKGINMTSKTLRDMRKELLDKYSEKMTGYEHLDDGTGDYARTISKDSEKESEETSEKT